MHVQQHSLIRRAETVGTLPIANTIEDHQTPKNNRQPSEMVKDSNPLSKLAKPVKKTTAMSLLAGRDRGPCSLTGSPVGKDNIGREEFQKDRETSLDRADFAQSPLQ